MTFEQLQEINESLREVCSKQIMCLKEKNEEIVRLEKLLAESEAKATIFAKRFYKEGIREFAKFLVDKAENGFISIDDLPEYTIEMAGDD